MFSLGDGAKFWLYTKPTDMRKNFNMLSGIVNNDMRQNLYSGDVFVFVNASNNMMKLLRHEPGGLVIYNKRLDHGRMHLVERIQEGDPTITPFEWRRLVDTIQGIIDDPRRRLQRLKVLRDVQMEASLKEAKTSENQQNKLRGNGFRLAYVAVFRTFTYRRNGLRNDCRRTEKDAGT